MSSAAPTSTRKANDKMRKTSLSQPTYRTPGRAKTNESHHQHIEDSTIRQNKRQDHGYDNFAYYPPHLVEALMPGDLLPRLPPLLKKEAKLFVLAYAAVYTAFERIDALEKDAPNRADPESSHKHLLSRRASDYSPTTVGAETPPIFSTPSIYERITSSSYTPAMRRPQFTMPPQIPVNMMGLESPPFTPVDSKVANTPINDGQKSMGAADLAHVNAELSKSAAFTTESPAMHIRNEIAYQTYVNQYNVEIADLKHHTYNRLEGYERTMARQFFEIIDDEDDLSIRDRAALQEFQFWWNEIKLKMPAIKARVDGLELKTMGLPPTEYGELSRITSDPL